MAASNKKQQQRATAKHNSAANKLEKDLKTAQDELKGVQRQLEKCKAKTSAEATRNEKEWKEISTQLASINRIVGSSQFGTGSTRGAKALTYARYRKIRNPAWLGSRLAKY